MKLIARCHAADVPPDVAVGSVCSDSGPQFSGQAERHWGMMDPGSYTLDEVADVLLTVLPFRPPVIWLTTI